MTTLMVRRHGFDLTTQDNVFAGLGKQM